MIRLATVADLPSLAPLIRQGCEWGQFPAPFVESVWVLYWTGLLSDPMAFIVVREEGGKIVAAMGGVVSMESHTAELVGCQIFMTTSGEVPGAGTSLIPEFEELSRQRGAKTVALMVTVACPGFARTVQSFIRRGYSPMLAEFVKRI